MSSLQVMTKVTSSTFRWRERSREQCVRSIRPTAYQPTRGKDGHGSPCLLRLELTCVCFGKAENAEERMLVCRRADLVVFHAGTRIDGGCRVASWRDATLQLQDGEKAFISRASTRCGLGRAGLSPTTARRRPFASSRRTLSSPRAVQNAQRPPGPHTLIVVDQSPPSCALHTLFAHARHGFRDRHPLRATVCCGAG